MSHSPPRSPKNRKKRQSGGYNACRDNARHACNFGNIRPANSQRARGATQKCPGYIIKTRDVTKQGKAKRKKEGVPEPPKGAKYYAEWIPMPGITEKGKDYWYKGEKGTNLAWKKGLEKGRGDPALLRKWNETRCLPRNVDGVMLPPPLEIDDWQPNSLCKLYKDKKPGQKQKGCHATPKGKGDKSGYKGVYKK